MRETPPPPVPDLRRADVRSRRRARAQAVRPLPSFQVLCSPKSCESRLKPERASGRRALAPCPEGWLRPGGASPPRQPARLCPSLCVSVSVCVSLSVSTPPATSGSGSSSPFEARVTDPVAVPVFTVPSWPAEPAASSLSHVPSGARVDSAPGRAAPPPAAGGPHALQWLWR